MPETTLTVEHEAGLHARPGVLFVRTARQFDCDITVIHGDKQTTGVSILNLMGLGVTQGSVITIRTDGPDADEALDALATLIKTNFGE
jgi:phosphocarrier protein